MGLFIPRCVVDSGTVLWDHAVLPYPCTVPKYHATVNYTPRLRAPREVTEGVRPIATLAMAVANHSPGSATANSYLDTTSTYGIAQYSADRHRRIDAWTTYANRSHLMKSGLNEVTTRVILREVTNSSSLLECTQRRLYSTSINWQTEDTPCL